MKNVKRKELVEKANEHELRLFQIEKALEQHGINWFSDEPKLKQLDQSVFDGLDEKWRFAAVDKCGEVAVYLVKPITNHLQWYVEDMSAEISYKYFSHMEDYDTTDWQNSLIERDTAELLEVDLSSELTGSDLCRAMLARGDKYVMCNVYDKGSKVDITHVIRAYHDGKFHTKANRWSYATPINNQGEPLTASEAGL